MTTPLKLNWELKGTVFQDGLTRTELVETINDVLTDIYEEETSGECADIRGNVFLKWEAKLYKPVDR